MEIIRELDGFNILKHFSTVEIKEMILDQIYNIDGICMGSGNMKDYFESIYYEYSEIYRNTDLDPDYKNELIDRYQQICIIILEAISDKFDIEIDIEGIASNLDELSTVTMILYDFFVISIHMQIYKIMVNYIIDNSDKLNEIFSEYANKRDASTITNKRYMAPEYSLICANIPDIITWIIANDMDTENIINYIDDEYTFKNPIIDLLNKGKITGDFGIKFVSLYTESLYLSGFVNFEVTAELKKRFDVANV